jgi:hypothetical protein
MNAPAEKFATDIKVLASDIEQLIKATTAQSASSLAFSF